MAQIFSDKKVKLSIPLRREMEGLVVPRALEKYDLPDLARVLEERLLVVDNDWDYPSNWESN